MKRLRCRLRGLVLGRLLGYRWDGHMRDESGCCVDCGDQR